MEKDPQDKIQRKKDYWKAYWQREDVKERTRERKKTEEYKQKKREYNNTIITCKDCGEEMKRKHYQEVHIYKHKSN